MTREEFFTQSRIYRLATKASVTSGGRTVAHNRAVGGIPTSPHLVDLAVDVVYDDPVAEETRKEIAEKLGIRLIIEKDHDHLQPLDWKAG